VGGAEALESEIKKLIVEALALEDVDPQQIETDAALFGEGLGLDSIDCAGARHGPNARIFASVRSLGEFVRTQGGQPRAGED
jgi:hypothetical protein